MERRSKVSYNENLISDQIDGGLQSERDLHDRFAGLAMQGLASNTEWSRTVNDDWDDYVERMTKGAYEIADAMIKARKEVKP